MAPQQPAQAAPGKKRILLIEDERDVLDMLHEILACEGHTTLAAHNGAAGLACFLDQQIDIVFTDMNMPGITGFDVAREVKKAMPGLPVVLLTGWDVDCEPFDLKAQGVDLLIKKPFAIQDILNALELLSA